tara:strand:+ start:1185 stop:2045 length:861 start_codon:yes stop_codon:yes gene_type:complete
MFSRCRNFLTQNKIKIINVYCNIGQKKIGVEQGGFHILNNFLNTESISFSNIMDIKCIIINNKKRYSQLTKAVRESLNENETILILGGDHSISSASIPSFLDKYRKNAHILWIDAHADINTKESSLTKNSHGMSLAKIFGLMKNDVIQNYYPSFSQLTYLGLRETDDFEKNIIQTNNIDILNISDIRNNKFNYNKFRNKKLYISIDVDVLDISEMSSTGRPSKKKGLITDELILFLQNICTHHNDNIKCIDIVEFNPLIGTQKDIDKSVNNITKLLLGILYKKMNE